MRKARDGYWDLIGQYEPADLSWVISANRCRVNASMTSWGYTLYSMIRVTRMERCYRIYTFVRLTICHAYSNKMFSSTEIRRFNVISNPKILQLFDVNTRVENIIKINLSYTTFLQIFIPKYCYLRQSISSDLSVQSTSPSHLQPIGMHFASLHWNWVLGHVLLVGGFSPGWQKKLGNLHKS